MMNKPSLYLVATPIGNLKEMSPRALEVLNSVAFIACEDTRVTKKLCQHFAIKTPLISCHEHNESKAVEKIIKALKDGYSVALTSDAGFPAISDPGELVVAKVLEQGFKIEVISGPCALINALVASGLSTKHFYFHGFLAHKVSERRKELESLAEREETLIFYEAPHRISETIELLIQTFGPRKACLARELTKKFEEFLRGSLEELRNILITRELKGEMVLVVEGYKKPERPTLSRFEVVDEVTKLVNQGLSVRDAIRQISKTYKLSKNEVYQLFHQ